MQYGIILKDIKKIKYVLERKMELEKCDVEKIKLFLSHKGARQVECVLQNGRTTSEVGAELIRRLHGSCTDITHDIYGAPYTRRKDSKEEVHISLTDEKGYTAGIAVVSAMPSRLKGVGIDIASVSSFSKDTQAFEKQFFHPGELEYLAKIEEQKRPLVKTIMFAIKEASLKSMADAIRPWTAEQENRFDYVEFQQFETHIIDDIEAYAVPTKHAAEASREIGIRKYEAIYIVCGSYVMSLVKSLM